VRIPLPGDGSYLTGNYKPHKATVQIDEVLLFAVSLELV